MNCSSSGFHVSCLPSHKCPPSCSAAIAASVVFVELRDHHFLFRCNCCISSSSWNYVTTTLLVVVLQVQVRASVVLLGITDHQLLQEPLQILFWLLLFSFLSQPFSSSTFSFSNYFVNFLSTKLQFFIITVQSFSCCYFFFNFC